MKIILNLTTKLLILLAICLTGCKKNSLEVKQDKIYVQINMPRPAIPGTNTGTSLTLKPNWNASITPPGDITYVGSYKIINKKIIIKIPDLNKEFTFDIVSETRLQSGSITLDLLDF